MPTPVPSPQPQPIVQADPQPALTLTTAASPAGPTPRAPRAPRTRAEPGLDLRSIFRTEASESLETLAEFLPPPDRALVVGYLRRAQPTAELAAITGRSAKSVRCRLRVLITRLNSPTFQLVAMHLNKWPRARRDAARAIFLHGLSFKVAAEQLGITKHRVKEHRAATLAVLEHLSANPRPMDPRVLHRPLHTETPNASDSLNK
ncbi:MAG: hypothetical protein PSX37_12680 [bacterium]|nr:hypothetical protein [bacterium]